ncbi:uncharacterized protein P884DRAFT_248678 [Thermothelomyces heterothallicus CBS 202.75]|uniref:uncharacterized protein n=1 Tax=Thermothelomyces heterothallicus CBS 202.75 TaxID=1149848 RepID=UPI0037432D35
MSSSTTLPTGSKPNHPPPERRRRITRVMLSNGYRAYHPQNTDGNKPPKQKKRVRFVRGHDSDGSVALSEASFDLESEEEEYDLFRDFPLHEADGWIPVMVAEEEEGNDWMSLTGSWMRMGDIVEAFK